MNNNIGQVLISGIALLTVLITWFKFAQKSKLQLEENADMAYYNLGLSALESGDYNKAIVAIKTATEINFKPYIYWHKIGLAYEKQGQYSAAVKAYKKEIANYNCSDQTKAELYLELGDLYNKKNSYRQAINCFSQAIKIDRNEVFAYRERQDRPKIIDKLHKYSEIARNNIKS